MKKKLLLIAVGILIGILGIKCFESKNIANSQTYKSSTNKLEDINVSSKKEVFYVHNLSELLDVLGNNRTIHIKEPINITKELTGSIPLNQFSKQYDGEHHKLIYESNFFSLKSKYILNNEDLINNERFYLIIKNTTNLTIVGNSDFTEIFVENEKTPILEFWGNKKLELRNLIFFREIETPKTHHWGNSFTPLLSFYNDKDVKIINCELDGSLSSSVGLFISNLNALIVENSKIHKCTNHALQISDTELFYFKNSTIIQNNIAFELINSSHSNLIFKDSKIINNKGNNGHFISSTSPNQIKFTNCTLKNNLDFRHEFDPAFDKSNNVNF